MSIKCLLICNECFKCVTAVMVSSGNFLQPSWLGTSEQRGGGGGGAPVSDIICEIVFVHHLYRCLWSLNPPKSNFKSKLYEWYGCLTTLALLNSFVNTCCFAANWLEMVFSSGILLENNNRNHLIWVLLDRAYIIFQICNKYELQLRDSKCAWFDLNCRPTEHWCPVAHWSLSPTAF